MVQILPSVADQLNPAIQAFSAGLEKYLKPNAEFQKSMQIAIGKNPELAQQFADLEANAPGTMEKMGFGELGKVIGQIPESAANLVARKNRGDIVQTAEQKLALEKAKGGFDLSNINELIRFLKDNPDEVITKDHVLSLLNLGTTATRRTQAAQATTAEAQAGVAEKVAQAGARTAVAGATVEEGRATATPAVTAATIAEAGAKVKEATVAEKAYSAALEKLPEASRLDFKKAARDFKAGTLDPGIAQSLMTTPGSKEAFGHAINIVNQEAQEALARSLDKSGSAEDRQYRSQAFQAYMKTKAGTMQAWETVLKDPEKIIAARQKAKDSPTTLTEPEKDIIQAADAMDEINKNEEVVKLRKINADITRNAGMLGKITAADNVSPEGINTYLNPLNDALAERGKTTGRTYIARYGPRPEVGESEKKALGTWWEGNGLYYTDEKGIRVKPDAILTDPAGPNRSLIADAAEYYSRLQSVTGAARATELDKLKKTDPELYDAVSNLLAKPARVK